MARSYHSSYNARDRDRIREDKLKEYGWTLHRIWSTSWIQNRRDEVERLAAAIRAAEARGDDHSVPPLSLSHDELQDKESVKPEIKVVPTTFSSIKEQVGVAYQVWNLKPQPGLRYGAENDLLRTSSYSNLLKSMVSSLVEHEGPIHREEVIHRIAVAAGYDKSGIKITQAVERSIGQCKLSGNISERDSFLWPVKMNSPQVRFPVENSYQTHRSIQHIPNEEMELAMKKIIKLGMSMEVDSLIDETARFYGFGKTGVQIREVLQDRVDELLRRGEFRMKDGYVHLDETKTL